jgi:hypothetical protein
MGSHRAPGAFARLRKLFFRRPAQRDDYAAARQLIAAIDRGGIPLNTAKINQIARDLGLEVSAKARVEDTIQRIREALERVRHYGQ